MTPAGHLLSGYLAGGWAAAGRTGSGRVILIALAIAGSLAPDADVLLGLAGGWEGAGLHRGATHSLAGALALGGLAAAAFRRLRARAFAAAFLGAATHIFWDALNVWGVRLLWPAGWYLRGNLVHERDLWALLIVAAATVLMWRGKRRAAALWLALAVPAYLAVQAVWRHQGRVLALRDLAGRRAGVYPTGRIRCPWIVLSAGTADMSVHCLPAPWSANLAAERRVEIRDDAFTRASQALPSVREFLEKIAFPYAERLPAPDGGALVVWRDLREAYEQDPGSLPAGLHVLLDAHGRVLRERHHWWLRLW